MRRAIIFALLLFVPAVLHARVIKCEGKALLVSISTERLTRIELPETLRSVFLSRPDIAVEKEDRSLFVRALAPEIEDTLFAVGESGTTYEINLSTSDNPDQTVVISHVPKSLLAQTERAGQVPVLDLMRSMIRGLPVGGYEIVKAEKKEVYRDAFLHERKPTAAVQAVQNMQIVQDVSNSIHPRRAGRSASVRNNS